MKKIGIALGGGGARGFAHVAMLEVFDELGLEPHVISGTSAGSIVGSLYAAGMKGVEIREWFDELLFDEEDTLADLIHKWKAIRSIEFLDLSFKQSGFFKGHKFTEKLEERIGVSTFEELRIPLRIVASDYWKSTQVVLDKGDLFSAVRASMCLPGVFVPAECDGRILIDGGGVNPVPHNILDDCDVVIAIDVMGFPHPKRPKVPSLFRTVIGMFDVMQNTIIEQNLKMDPPNLYIKPNLQGIDIIDFHRSSEVYKQSESAVEELHRWLSELMESW